MPTIVQIHYAANKAAIDAMAVFLLKDRFTVSVVEAVDRLQVSDAGSPLAKPNLDVQRAGGNNLWVLIARK